jgi:predicted AAA+ superfamily ATPase
MIISRQIEPEIITAMNSFPVVIITGARQTGKTTVAKQISNKPYYNLESPDTRELATNDPRLFFSKIKDTGAIIDEFQRVPELASYIQEIVDEKGKNGMFLLTGSNNFLLMEKVSQSLAGRAAILKLMPFSYPELKHNYAQISTDELIYKGFYPAIHSKKLNPTKTYSYYYQTYLERDVRQLINVKDINLFQRFMKLCSGRVGQLLNYDQLASETGVSNKVIKTWISVLEASYIIHLLPPYFENIKKRVIKSPKLYFYDVGFAAYLLNIEKVSHIESHPLRGQLFENMVINEYLKYRFNIGMDANAFFYRDNHKNEVDLFVQSGNNIDLFEIKSAATYHSGFRKNIDWLEKQIEQRKVRKSIIYDGEKEWKTDELEINNFRSFAEKLYLRK